MKKSNSALLTFCPLFFGGIISFVYNCWSLNPDTASIAAVNTYLNGGTVVRWLYTAKLTDKDSGKSVTRKGDEEVINSILDSNLLGGSKDEANYIQTILNGASNGVGLYSTLFSRPCIVEANYNGIVTTDSAGLNVSGQSVGYALCKVESAFSARVRCFYGIDAPHLLFVNGFKVKPLFSGSDSCIPMANFADIELVQGANTILLKFLFVKRSPRFTLELWPVQDSLRVYARRIESVSLQWMEKEPFGKGDSAEAKVSCSVLVPSRFLSARVWISLRAPDLQKPYMPDMLLEVPVEHTFKMGLPSDFKGFFTVQTECSLSVSRKFSSRQVAYRGSLTDAVEAYLSRFRSIIKRKNDTPVGLPFNSYVFRGVKGFLEQWFIKRKEISGSSFIEELSWVDQCCNLLEDILSGKPIARPAILPLALTPAISERLDTMNIYDYSTWLNYRYPDRFLLPQRGTGVDTIMAWMFIPGPKAGKLDDLPCILSLHGAALRDSTMSRLRIYGPGGYAERNPELPCIVLTPACRGRYLWDTKKLKVIIDDITATSAPGRRGFAITGTDMGGFASWHLANTYPSLFSAVIPINGSGDPEKVCILKKMPLWIFYGGKSGLLSLDQVQRLLVALKECGNRTAKLSIFPDASSPLEETIYRDPTLYEWIFKNIRR